MEKIYFDTLKETLYHEKMDNGLEVYLLPKQGFEKTGSKYCFLLIFLYICSYLKETIRK